MNKKIKALLGRMGYHRKKYPCGLPSQNRFIYFWVNDRVPYRGQISEKDINEIVKKVLEDS